MWENRLHAGKEFIMLLAETLKGRINMKNNLNDKAEVPATGRTDGYSGERLRRRSALRHRRSRMKKYFLIFF
jgi:hypothetical protein